MPLKTNTIPKSIIWGMNVCLSLFNQDAQRVSLEKMTKRKICALAGNQIQTSCQYLVTILTELSECIIHLRQSMTQCNINTNCNGFHNLLYSVLRFLLEYFYR
jgi:hypothetical protein